MAWPCETVPFLFIVMPVLVTGIHVFLFNRPARRHQKSWMVAPSATMTIE